MRSTSIVLAISLVSTAALAGPKPKGPKKEDKDATAKEAKDHIDKATKAHAAGKYDVALSELRAAYNIDPQPDLLYAMGQVFSKLGRCTDATDSFEKFRAEKKNDPTISKVVDEAIAACKPTSTPFQDSHATEGPTEPAKTEPVKAEPPPPPAEPPPPPAEPTPVVVQPPPPAAEGSHAWYGDVLGDVLVAGGVVAVISAGFEYKSARSSLDDAENAMSLDSYNKLVDDAHSKRNVSLLLGGAGAALIAGGLVHYMFHGKHGETHSVAIVPTSGGGFITLSGDL